MRRGIFLPSPPPISRKTKTFRRTTHRTSKARQTGHGQGHFTAFGHGQSTHSKERISRVTHSLKLKGKQSFHAPTLKRSKAKKVRVRSTKKGNSREPTWKKQQKRRITTKLNSGGDLRRQSKLNKYLDGLDSLSISSTEDTDENEDDRKRDKRADSIELEREMYAILTGAFNEKLKNNQMLNARKKLKGFNRLKAITKDLGEKVISARNATKAYADKVHDIEQKSAREKMQQFLRHIVQKVEVINALKHAKMVNHMGVDPIVSPKVLEQRRQARFQTKEMDQMRAALSRKMRIQRADVLKKARVVEKRTVCTECGATMSRKMRAKAFLHRVEKWQKIVPHRERPRLFVEAQKIAKMMTTLDQHSYLTTRETTKLLANIRLRSRYLADTSEASIHEICSLLNTNNTLKMRHKGKVMRACRESSIAHHTLHNDLKGLAEDAAMMTLGKYNPEMFKLYGEKTDFMTILDEIEHQQTKTMKECESLMADLKNMLDSTQRKTAESIHQLEKSYQFLQTINQRKRFHGRLVEKQRVMNEEDDHLDDDKNDENVQNGKNGKNSKEGKGSKVGKHSKHGHVTHDYIAFKKSVSQSQKARGKTSENREHHMFYSIAMQNCEMDLEIDRQSSIIMSGIRCIKQFRKRMEQNEQLTVEHVLSTLNRILREQLTLDYANEMRQLQNEEDSKHITLKKTDYYQREVTDLVLMWKKQLNACIKLYKKEKVKNAKLTHDLEKAMKRAVALDMYKSMRTLASTTSQSRTQTPLTRKSVSGSFAEFGHFMNEMHVN